MYDDRTNLGQLVARDVREFFKEKVFNTIIPRNVKLGEAPSHGMPAALYDAKSRRRRRLRRARQRSYSRGTPLKQEPLMLERRPALGKGLSALIPDAPEPIRSGSMEVDIDLLSPNEQQPRLHDGRGEARRVGAVDQVEGNHSADSRARDGAAYRIIAGERRWRAAQRAGLQRVPVVVRDVAHGDKQLLELALIENLQRENLNPVDEALAYQRLAEDFSLTQDQIAAAVGKDRSSVANFMRLLRLPEEVRGDLATGALSTGHARALLPLPDATAQRQAAREVISRGLSVREAEALVKRLLAQGAARNGARAVDRSRQGRPYARGRGPTSLRLGTKVRIIRRGQGGRIEVDFGSEAELNRIYEYMTSPR